LPRRVGEVFAVNVTTPNPRNAKNVSATLDTMSRHDGYPAGSSSDTSMFATVTAANASRMPTTIHTMIDCTLAAAWLPTMFNHSIASRIAAANTLSQPAAASSPMNSDEA
jgi:hypothetical protein